MPGNDHTNRVTPLSGTQLGASSRCSAQYPRQKRFRGSARKHGITDAEIEHAWHHAIRLVEYEYDGQERLLIGTASTAARWNSLLCLQMNRRGSSTLIDYDRSFTTT